MEQRYLIDSNVIIDFFNGSMPENGRRLLSGIEPAISIINQIEIFSSKLITEQELHKLNQFINIDTIYEVNNAIANQTIRLRLSYKIKLPDAIIAATAVHHNLILLTRNKVDFGMIKSLNILNPHTL